MPDREKVKAFLQHLGMNAYEYKQADDTVCGYDYLEVERIADDALALLKEQEEVTPMYGYWVQIDDDSNIWKCSVCDEPQIIIDGSPFENEWKFCPNCGSMMTKEKVKREGR